MAWSPAEAAGFRDPTHGFCHPSSHAGALGAPPRLISSAFLLLERGEGVSRMCPVCHPGWHIARPLVPLSSPPPSPGLLPVWVCGGWGRTQEVGVGLTSSTQRVLAQRLYFPLPAAALGPPTHPEATVFFPNCPTGQPSSSSTPPPRPLPGSGQGSHV